MVLVWIAYPWDRQSISVLCFRVTGRLVLNKLAAKKNVDSSVLLRSTANNLISKQDVFSAVADLRGRGIPLRQFRARRFLRFSSATAMFISFAMAQVSRVRSTYSIRR